MDAGDLPYDLMAKIKALNETVWENKAKESAVLDWLSNFDQEPPSLDNQRASALYLLSNFMYFGSRQIRELLKAMYRDLYRYPIIEKIRRANGDTTDSRVLDRLFEFELQKTRFMGMGNPSESGSHLLYFFRQENLIPKDLFVHSHQIFTRTTSSASLSLRDSTVKRYVFIDDFCGSGKQGVEYSSEVVEAIKAIKSDAIVCYYVLFATTAGITKIREETVFDEVKAIYELDESFRCFSALSRNFRSTPLGVSKEGCEELARKYGRQMVPEEHCLGFDDCQLLIGFHHNTPDNTLPVIWFDEREALPWSPIFRRYPKLMSW